MKILGIKINNLTKQQILQKIEFVLNKKNKKFHQVVTVNPEFILQAQKDQKFKNVLNNTALSIADGVGLKFAAWRFGKNLKCKFAGIDLMWEILQIASKKKQKVFLIANKDGLSTWQKTAEAIEKVYPNLEISGTNINENISNYELPVANYEILFCAWGSPQQEILINSLKNTSLKLAMGVGGSFDFITGKVKRAPKWLCVIGLEWLWRLILEPRYRIKKIWNAIIVFPIKVIFNN